MSKNIQLWFLIASTGPIIWFEINFWFKTKWKTAARGTSRGALWICAWKISFFVKVKKVKIWINQWFLRNVIGQSYFLSIFEGRTISCGHFGTLFVSNYVEISSLSWSCMSWFGIRLHWRVQLLLYYDIGTPYFRFVVNFKAPKRPPPQIFWPRIQFPAFICPFRRNFVQFCPKKIS